jgi:hypothetical protein
MNYAGAGGAVQFPFGANFPGLIGNDGKAPAIDAACVAIEAEWSGIFTLWSTFDQPTQVAKQNLLEGYLVAWWLADMYPTKVKGIQSDGGMPLTSKSIGGVSISRKDLKEQTGLSQLMSNAFGMKAFSLMKSAPEMFQLFGQNGSMMYPQGSAPTVTGAP